MRHDVSRRQQAQRQADSRNHQSKIYSYNTMTAYLQQCCNFVTFCKNRISHQNSGCLQALCRCFLQREIDSRKSSYTIKLAASALGKLYQCSTKDFFANALPVQRSDHPLTGQSKAGCSFSEKNHEQLVNFCCCTGLRRHELNALTGDCLHQDSDGNFIIHVERGKEVVCVT